MKLILFLRRKKEAREPHERAQKARALRGLKAKIANKERFKEKVQMKKTIRMHELRNVKQSSGEAGGSGEKPVFLLDREEQNISKVLSNTVKQKRAEKAVCFRFRCVTGIIYFFHVNSLLHSNSG